MRLVLSDLLAGFMAPLRRSGAVGALWPASAVGSLGFRLFGLGVRLRRRLFPQPFPQVSHPVLFALLFGARCGGCAARCRRRVSPAGRLHCNAQGYAVTVQLRPFFVGVRLGRDFRRLGRALSLVPLASLARALPAGRCPFPHWLARWGWPHGGS